MTAAADLGALIFVVGCMYLVYRLFEPLLKIQERQTMLEDAKTNILEKKLIKAGLIKEEDEDGKYIPTENQLTDELREKIGTENRKKK